MLTNQNELLSIAIEAAIDAGKSILEVYELPDFDTALKDDQSPLTKADIASNNVINTILQPTPFPIISEENKQLAYATRKKWDTCWMVDPLDGTKEFIKRNGEFTVNIALIKNGVPVLGVIYVPVTRELYYADVENKIAYKTLICRPYSC